MLRIIGSDKGNVILDKEILDEDNRITPFGALLVCAELAFDATIICLVSRAIAKRK